MNKFAFFRNPQVKKIFEIVVPLVLFAVAFFWKFTYLNARDICLDEPYTIFNAQDSILNIIKIPTQNEPSPPLFMLIMHFWIKVFGISPESVRIVPLLFNAITAVVLYFTGKRFFNFWSGFTASALFIFSTYHFFYGLDTRTYSMLSCATACSLYFLLAIVRNPEEKRYLIALLVSNLFLVYGHYFGWFVVFIEFVAVFFYLKNKSAVWKIVLAIVATFLLYIPMFSVLIKQFFISKESTWVVPPPKSEFLQQIRSFLNYDLGFKIAAGALLLGIMVAVITKPGRKQLKEVLVLLVWWLVPFSLMFLVSSKVPMFNSRYILFNTVGFYLFIGVAINYLFQKIKFSGAIISIGLAVAMYFTVYTEDFAPRKIKNSVEFALEHVDSNTSVIIYPHWADLGFMYYFNPDIFRSIDNYHELLKENNIYQAWGLKDTQEYQNKNHQRKIVLFEDNTPEIDRENSVFNHLDSVMVRTDSAVFRGGIVVSVFEPTE